MAAQGASHTVLPGAQPGLAEQVYERVALDPDRLAPMDNPVDTVEVFLKVKGWDRAKFEEIERLTRQRAIRAAAVRHADSLTADRLGAPEDTVISVNLVRFPEKRPARTDPADS